MMAYRIRNWERHFENNRTKELRKMSWVPVPNKHDGDGYTDLMSRKNAMALYGAWHLILQVASKCEPRGTLVRDIVNPAPSCGDAAPSCGDAAPSCAAHNGASIARLTRGDGQIIEAMLKVGIEIGWIEQFVMDNEVTESRENPAPSCGNPAPSCAEWKGKKGREGKGREAAPARVPVEMPDVPDSLNRSPDFADAFLDYQAHRKEIKKPLTPTATRNLFLKFSRWGSERATAALRHSLANGWEGVYEEGYSSGKKTVSALKDPDEISRSIAKSRGLTLEEYRAQQDADEAAAELADRNEALE